MNFPEWLTQTTTDSRGDVAARVGLPLRTLQYQLRNRPKIETVIAIADAYGHSPFVALVDLGYVDARWLSDLEDNVTAALMAATPDQLTDEILRRLNLGSSDFDTPVDDLAARRSNTAPPPIGDVGHDERPLRVADSSPDHPEESTEFDD